LICDEEETMIGETAVRATTRNQVTMPSRAWYGDGDLTLDFPASWRVQVLPPQDAAKLDPAGIAAAFANPIGTPTIAELARGKRSAAIVVDDISRPTPAAELVPYVLAELAAAGVPKDEIRFVIGGGSHRPQTREEMAKKLGAEVVAEYEVTTHNFMAGDLRGLGSLPDGTPLYFNRVVADAGFKMTIGGIYPHGSVGFGGGSKLILPGVAGFATMFHFHTFYPSRGQGNIERQGDTPDHRDASEAAARVLGLDVVVNAVLNSRREIAALYVGDFVQAQRAGARRARQVYGTHIPAELRREADVVVVNAYPLDSDPIQTTKATWTKRYFEKAYTVVVNPAVDGICYHGLFDRIDWGRFNSQRLARPPRPEAGAPGARDPEPVLGRRDQSLIWSEHFPAYDFPRRLPNDILVRRWETVIDLLRPAVPDDARVAVFPASGIQLLAAE
jgi:nickel-dependent lactate racemase